jgi:hypothetical protein
MSYRDDLDAAQQRSYALEQELARTRAHHADDAQRVAALERALLDARRSIDALTRGQGNPYGAYVPPLPRSQATMVLVFGVLSLTVCSLFGPFAWHYGNAEIDKMDRGIVDPKDRGMAIAGKICGIVASALLILCGFFLMLMLAAA